MTQDGQQTPGAAPAAPGAPAVPAAAVSGSGWQRAGTALVYRGRGPDNSQAWLLTFTDLSALMLTFFVLLFSMSSINDSDWQNLIDALSTRLDRVQQVTVALPQSEKAADAVEREPGSDLDYLAAVLTEQMGANPLLAKVQVARKDGHLVISVPGDLLFSPGSTGLSEAGEKAAFSLASVLRSLRNVIEIAGHADPTPAPTPYPSNWELSLARAAVLSGLLSKVGYKGEILVRGYGDARFADVDPGLPADQRRAQARRVDIIVHGYASEAR